MLTKECAYHEAVIEYQLVFEGLELQEVLQLISIRLWILESLSNHYMFFGIVHSKFLQYFHHMISNSLLGLILSMENLQINRLLKALDKVQLRNASPYF